MVTQQRPGDLPTGTVTFVFTDVEGSTRLLNELGAERYATALADHRRVVREAFVRHGGVEVDTQGDAFFFAFPTPTGAAAAARSANDALASHEMRIRVGIHTGTPQLVEEGYVGVDVHRAARIAASGHGGQVLVSAATAALLGDNGLRDLGEHRLKDLSAPERIYQLGDGDFPPLRSLYQTNLPIPPTPFIGRERELGEVGTLIGRVDARLVTLTGTGGTGKTRLAVQAAVIAADGYPDGVWWVPLAPVRDPGLVIDTVRAELGAPAALDEHIADRSMLLLLDNFEQVIEAASDVAALLARCPRLTIVVTSRELLGVPGEHVYPVPPLEPADGTALFAARARAVLPDFESGPAVAELVERLENLPLALELAAARVRMLSPEQLLDRLTRRLDLLKGGRGMDPRQQTLHATIEWSYDLLSADERALFRRLAVFRGGWTLEAADAVCAADLDTLQSLLDKSLVRRRGDGRFLMLETIREYAEAQLALAGDDAAVRAIHADHYAAIADRAYQEQAFAEDSWSPVLAAEHDNVRAALDWAVAADPDTAVRLAGAVAPYWMRRGHAKEARSRLDAALALHTSPDRLRARAMLHRAELDQDIPGLEGALRLARQVGDARAEAIALDAIGWAHDANGDYAAARLSHEESLAVIERAGLPAIEGGLVRAGLCHVLVATGDVVAAESAARELLQISQGQASLLHELALHFLADCALLARDWPEAERRYLAALRFARQAELFGRATDEAQGVAMALAGRGAHTGAVRIAAAAGAKQEELGKTAPDAWWQSMLDRLLGPARDALNPHDLAAAEAAGRDTPFDALLEQLLDAPSSAAGDAPTYAIERS